MPRINSTIIQEQYSKLLKIFVPYRTGFVAFSGGIDSSLVAKAALDALGQSATAVTIDSELVARRDIEFARNSADSIGIKHKIIKIKLLENSNINVNNSMRCYFCKKAIINAINMFPLFDGSHADDPIDRPGLKAIKEAGVISPLAQAGFNKYLITETAKYLNLISSDKPSNSCLATRITTGQNITIQKLALVEKAEKIMFKAGVIWCRARINNQSLLIEYGSKIPLNEHALSTDIAKNLINETTTKIQFLKK